VSTLVDAASMEGSKAEEEKQDAELAIAGVAGDSNVGLQATVAATFALVFVAEWGDKSFFSTIALAAASSPAGVVTGAIAGHGVATVLAVLGGSFLSEFISEKLIAYIGGVLFLVFAATTLVDILK
jgi:putative Ca2+/H+ antiporter (TMEM165/GDT1 family)